MGVCCKKRRREPGRRRKEVVVQDLYAGAGLLGDFNTAVSEREVDKITGPCRSTTDINPLQQF